MSQDGFCIVVRADHGLGFRLAGASVRELDASSVEAGLGAALADRSIGVLAIEEELLSHAPKDLLERAFQQGLPIVVPFSIPRGWTPAGGAEEYVGRLLRRAIGYRVKLAR